MNKDRSEWSQFRRVLQVMKASPPWLGCPTAIRIGGVVGGGRAKGGSGLEGKAMTLTFGPAMKDKLGDPPGHDNEHECQEKRILPSKLKKHVHIR